MLKLLRRQCPEDPKYAYTLAYYQLENNQKTSAVKTLQGIIKNYPQYLNAASLLADIYVSDGRKKEAVQVYEQALKTEGISEQDKMAIQQAINSIQQGL